MKKARVFVLFLLLLPGCASGNDDGSDEGKTGGNRTDPDAVRLIPSAESKPISENIFGYNTQSIKGPGWDKAVFIDRIAALDPGNFRYPGGTVGNFWDWRTGYYNEIGQRADVIAPSPAGPFPYKLDHVKAVYDRTGAVPVYMINMLTSTCEEQLAMLAYAQSIGLPVKYIEMGNEYYLDDHPEKYNYLTAFPTVTDYTDSCRTWTTRFRRAFPQAEIALIGVHTPAAWTKRPRAREWNTGVMNRMEGIECDALTIHIYPKNGLDSPTPYDMIGQSLAAVAPDKVLDASIDSRYKLWVTEYNFESGSNPFPGQWVHGLAAVLMSARLIVTPRVELICFFNLTAGKSASAIFDADVSIRGQTAPKYTLSATGEGLKMLAQALQGATTVRTVRFSDNPQVTTRKQGRIDTLYGFLFGGSAPKLLLINLGAETKTVGTEDLGFTPVSFEQISGGSPETAVTGPSSLARLSRKLNDSGAVVLRPYSVTVVR